MLSEKNKISSLNKLADKLPDLILKLAAAHKDIEGYMDRLEKQGLVYANEHWRSGKYLYLLYPMRQGERRRREYVGNDAEKVKAAKEAITRAAEYDKLKRLLLQLEQVSFDSHSKIQETVSMLAKW